MIIDIKKIAAELKIKLPDLITRPIGKRMFERVKELLANAGEEEVVILDFDGVKVLDASFVDELLIRLIKDSREGEKCYFLKLKNVSYITEINIDTVLNSHHSYNNEKISIATENMTSKNSCYLGVLSEIERDIIDYLRVNKSAGTNEISSYIGIGESETDKLIDGLYRMRILRKLGSGGSRKYITV